MIWRGIYLLFASQCCVVCCALAFKQCSGRKERRILTLRPVHQFTPAADHVILRKSEIRKPLKTAYILNEYGLAFRRETYYAFKWCVKHRMQDLFFLLLHRVIKQKEHTTISTYSRFHFYFTDLHGMIASFVV